MASNDSVRRSQAQRRAASEEAILAAAADLIAERGVEGASLARIGDRAGSSRGLPTHHFGSKDQLVDRLAARAQETVLKVTIAVVEEAQRGGEALAGLELIRLSVSAYLEHFERPDAEMRSLIVMWGATFPSHSVVDSLLEADLRAYDGWARLVEQGQRDGSIRADIEPGAAAVLLHGMTRGLAALLITDGESSEAEGLRRACDAFLANGLATSSLDRRAAPLRTGGDRTTDAE